jgi:hypothetical protein
MVLKVIATLPPVSVISPFPLNTSVLLPVENVPLFVTIVPDVPVKVIVDAFTFILPPVSISSFPVVSAKFDADTVSKVAVALVVRSMSVVPVTESAAPRLTVRRNALAAVGLIVKLFEMATALVPNVYVRAAVIVGESVRL